MYYSLPPLFRHNYYYISSSTINTMFSRLLLTIVVKDFCPDLIMFLKLKRLEVRGYQKPTGHLALD